MPPRTAHRDAIPTRTTEDHIEALRVELRTIAGRLDAYLAEQARPHLTAVPPTTADPDAPDPLDGLPAFISVDKAAGILGLSRAAAYRLAAADELPVRRLGGRVYIVTAGLRALLDGAA